EPHRVHALDCRHDVQRAADRPPAIASGLHELGSVEPLLRAARRSITAVPAAFEFETEQLEPVAQARQRDELAFARQEWMLRPGTRQPLARAPEADRVEARDDDPAL